MFPGLVGELVNAAAHVTEAHPACVASQFLVGLGNAIGRDAYTYVGETRHGVNEFLLVVGPTSTARKGDGKNVAFVPLEEADPSWAGLVASGLSSGEGLIYAVRDAERTNRRGEEIITDPGVTDKRLCVVETEFSQALKMFRREGNILSNTLRDAWDGKRVLRTLTKGSPIRATEAHISGIGHTTVEDLRQYLADLDVANGTGNRFLFVAADRVREIPDPPRMPDAVRGALVHQVRGVLEHARGVGIIRRTPAASRVWSDLYCELTKPRPGLRGALLARGPAHVTRLSTLFALLARARAVDTAHLVSAVAWWDYCVRSVEIIFADRTGNDVADRIRAEMLPGQALTLSELREQVFAGHVSAGRLRDALELLRDLGEVRLEPRDTPGRPALVVVRVDRGAEETAA